MNRISTVNVIGIPLFNGSIEAAITQLVDETKHEQKHSWCVSATGAHGIVTAQRDDEFRKTLNEFYMNLPDGMPGVWIGKIKGAKKIERCYGPDFFRELISRTANDKLNHFFCGGKEGVAEELRNVCSTRFGNKNIVGIYSPPFREMTDCELMELAEKIEKTQADILWIGISTPKQEKLAQRISRFCKVHFIITVGAAFDFHIGKVRQAPKIFQKLGLEWLFRLSVEPRRLWKRYVEIVPLFIYYNLLELLSINKNNRFV